VYWGSICTTLRACAAVLVGLAAATGTSQGVECPDDGASLRVTLQAAAGGPAATATVLSSDYIQPAVQGPWMGGLDRVEYTVGVAGCNQRNTYVVLCQVGTDTCFAAHPGDRFRGGKQ